MLPSELGFAVSSRRFGHFTEVMYRNVCLAERVTMVDSELKSAGYNFNYSCRVPPRELEVIISGRRFGHSSKMRYRNVCLAETVTMMVSELQSV